ncbi:MAG TPA: hypothetical protein VF092_16200 [Longimicrobium sp.]
MNPPRLSPLTIFVLAFVPALAAAAPAGFHRPDAISIPRSMPQDSAVHGEGNAHATRPFTACMAQASGPVQVFGMIDDESGDTVAVVRGNRLPLRTAYPAVPSAAAARWFARGESIRLGAATYVRTGPARELAPGSVAAYGRFAGVPVYAAPGASRPGSVFVPLDGCRFQEFRASARDAGR